MCSGHSKHDVADSEGMYQPGLQRGQNCAPTLLVAEPAAHGEHSKERGVPANEPASHGTHSVAASRLLAVPAGQSTQPTAPEKLENVADGQGVHVSCPRVGCT